MESIDAMRDWWRDRFPVMDERLGTEFRWRIDAIEREGMADRTAAYDEGYDAGFASADDWAAQHEDAMAEHGWVRLPVDADGVPIHVGDVMAAKLAHGGSGRWVVDRMELTRAYDQDLWQIALDKDGACWVTPSTVRHHRAPTVEDVLREFWSDVDLAVADCGDPSSIIAEYAAKLTLRGDE